jgi:hypothetical protein
VYPHLPEVAVLETPLEPAARPPERLMAEPIAWCPRPAAVREAESPFAGQEARRSAQPAASAAPVGVLPPEESVVPSARPEAAAVAWRASAAEVARQPAAAVALRARAGVAAGWAWAAELPQGAAVAVRLWAAEGPEAAAEARAAAAVARQPAVLDAGQQLAARLSAVPSVFHPDQALPWPAPPPTGRFAHAMRVPRIAWP